MIKKIIFYILLCVMAGCSVTIESPQFTTIKSLLNKSRYNTLGKQWFIVFENKLHEAYAIQNKTDVTFVSLEHLEIDFKHTLITSIRALSPYKNTILFDYSDGSISTNFISANSSKTVYVKCEPLLQHSEYVYVQSCYNNQLNWHFQNELQVNESRDVVFIKTFYDPNKPAVELYFNQVYKP